MVPATPDSPPGVTSPDPVPCVVRRVEMGAIRCRAVTDVLQRTSQKAAGITPGVPLAGRRRMMADCGMGVA